MSLTEASLYDIYTQTEANPLSIIDSEPLTTSEIATRFILHFYFSHPYLTPEDSSNDSSTDWEKLVDIIYNIYFWYRRGEYFVSDSFTNLILNYHIIFTKMTLKDESFDSIVFYIISDLFNELHNPLPPSHPIDEITPNVLHMLLAYMSNETVFDIIEKNPIEDSSTFLFLISFNRWSKRYKDENCFKFAQIKPLLYLLWNHYNPTKPSHPFLDNLQNMYDEIEEQNECYLTSDEVLTYIFSNALNALLH